MYQRMYLFMYLCMYLCINFAKIAGAIKAEVCRKKMNIPIVREEQH